MSVNIDVLVEVRNLPIAVDWQKAISANGFPLSIDISFDMKKDSGFLPCTLDGHETGFEIDTDLLEDTMLNAEQNQKLASLIGSRGLCVGLSVPVSEGKPGVRAAIIAAVTLADMSDGILVIEGEVQALPDLIEWGRESIASI